jgi:hypothetical protein
MTTLPRVSNNFLIRIRWNADIGLWTIDRPTTTCTWRTEFCEEHCYNKKLYKAFPSMHSADKKNALYWHSLSLPQDVAEHFKRRAVKRLRLMSRGEAFSTAGDVYRVAAIAKANPDITIKIPTRAWRDKYMKRLIKQELIDVYPNLRISASIDPSNTEDELIQAYDFGCGTLYFGSKLHPFGSDITVKCPKTWAKKKQACKTCNICYGKKRVHVHLAEH